ncbi:MAG: S1C family serine protease [Coprococcus sp.]
MAFDDQDRVNHTDTENRSEEHPTAEGTQQKNEEAESSGLYRMTREDLKNSTLYTEPVHSSTTASENVGGTGRSAGHTGSSYATGNDYSYYHAPQNSSNSSNSSNGGNGGHNGGGAGFHGGPEKKHTHKKGGFGKTVAKAACLGVVFGLAASAVMFGVNKATGISSSANNSSTAAYNVNIVKTSAAGVETTDSKDVSDIVSNVMPGIVAVNTTVESTSTDWFGRQYTQESKGAGSGMIISEENNTLYVMTNYHVVEGAKEVSVQFNDGNSATATVKGYDEDKDVAVLTIDMSQLSEDTKNAIAVMVMGDSDQLKAGESAIAIGNALGYGQSVTTGVISAVNREVSLTDKTMTLVQTSAAINPGNSGGALLNGKGEVIGMNTVKYSDTSVEGMGYAIPINTALETAKGIIDGTIVAKTDETTAFLGITGGTLDEDTASAYNAPAGIYVSNVASGSAAQRAGLQAGCIITGFNGKDVSTMEDLQKLIQNCAPGDSVTITAQFPDSNGNYSEQTLTTIMGSKADAEDSSQSTQQNGQNQQNGQYGQGQQYGQ